MVEDFVAKRAGGFLIFIMGVLIYAEKTGILQAIINTLNPYMPYLTALVFMIIGGVIYKKSHP